MATSASFDSSLLAPVRLRLGLARLVRQAVRGFAAGAVAGIVLLLLLRIGLTLPLGLPAVLPPVGALVGAALAARRWPATLEAARTVDRYFALHDRVTTALQLSSARAALPSLQRDDTLQRMEGLHLTDSNRLGIPRREAGAAGAALILFAVLLILPQPASHAPAGPASGSDRFHHAVVKQVPAITKHAESGLTSGQRHNPALRALTQALAHLQHELLKSPNRRTALRAISATQQRLHQIAASQHPISPAAAHAAGQALQHQLSTSERRQLASAHGNKALTALAKSLQHLASSLQHMSPAQREALAKALARAANNTANSTLRSALHAAASSLGYNDPQSAQSALRSAAQALSQSPSSAAAQSRASAAASSLSSLKNAVSGLNGQSSNQVTALGGGKARQGSGQSKGNGSGKEQGTGRGQGNGSGKGSGKGTGQGSGQGNGSGFGKGSGSGSGHGSGRGNGSGHGSGSGSGGTGGHGAGGGRGGSGPQGQGRYANSHVYIPQRPHNGPHTILNGPNGQPLPGSSVPYNEVVGRYAQTARTALDRSSLPPTLQSEVRRYFSAISH